VKRALASTFKLVGLLLGCLVLVAIVGIFWPPATAPLPSDGRDHLIRNVRIVDVELGRSGAPTSVLVRGGVIQAIGDLPGTPDIPVLDGKGGYLVPGFWDMHMHSFQLSPQLHFPLFVANGVTSVRDMMDCPEERDTLIACAADKNRWNAQAEAGLLASPRFVEVASYYFENPELTPEEVSVRARTYAGRGLDILKVYNRLPRPAYFRVAEEARRNRMRLGGHLPKAISLDEALAAGQTTFEHAHVLVRHCFREADAWRQGGFDGVAPIALAEAMVARHDPAACQRAFAAMRSSGAWLVPTHVTREEDARAGDPAFINDPRLDYLDPLSRWAYRDDLAGTRGAYGGARGERALRTYFRHGLRLTGEAHRAGVAILVGTDTALGGFRYHDEMRHLVSAGMSPAAVLRAATIDAARYAGLDRTQGSVAVGKKADLVLLSGNPLTDIQSTGRIDAVMSGGHLYDRRRLDQLLAFTKSQATAPTNWIKLLWGFARSSVTSDL
jgi:imidazolonepropionase-like amidohydrolase